MRQKNSNPAQEVAVTFRKECQDCKYCKGVYCTHPHQMHCNNCELWTPKN